MSSKKAPVSTIQAPSLYSDPFYQKSQDLLFPISEGLSKGHFMDPNDPTVGFLNQLTSLNPEATKTSVGLATRDVNDQYDIDYRQIMNDLAANNQLESSVTGNRLSDLSTSHGKNISDINSQFYLADVERMMSNIGNLFQLGLGTASDVRGGALTNQSQVNDFNLANYPNQVTAEQLNKPVATRGGIGGALTGGLGGAMTGFTMGGPWGALIGGGLGAAAGGFGSPQTGGQIGSLGAMTYGMGKDRGLSTSGSFDKGLNSRLLDSIKF